jgi:hypothetical protein
LCDDGDHVDGKGTVVMATNSSRQAHALAQARERRRLLDQARDEQDARVEQATAAALLEVEVADIRRLAKLTASPAAAAVSDSAASLLAAAGGDFVAIPRAS